MHCELIEWINESVGDLGDCGGRCCFTKGDLSINIVESTDVYTGIEYSFELDGAVEALKALSNNTFDEAAFIRHIDTLAVDILGFIVIEGTLVLRNSNVTLIIGESTKLWQA